MSCRCRCSKKCWGKVFFGCYVLPLVISIALFSFNIFMPVEDVALSSSSAEAVQSGDVDQDRNEGESEGHESTNNADGANDLHSNGADQNQIDKGIDGSESTDNVAKVPQSANRDQDRVEPESTTNTDGAGDLDPSAKSAVSEEEGSAPGSQKNTEQVEKTMDSSRSEGSGSGENLIDSAKDLNPQKETKDIPPSFKPTELTRTLNDNLKPVRGKDEDENELNEQSISANSPTAPKPSENAKGSSNQKQDDPGSSKSKTSRIVLIVLGSVLSVAALGVAAALWCKKNHQVRNADDGAKVQMIHNAAKNSQQTRQTAAERPNGEYQFMNRGTQAQNEI